MVTPFASFSNLVGSGLIIVALIVAVIGVTIALTFALSLYLTRSSDLGMKPLDMFVKYASKHRYIQFAAAFCVYFVLFWLINLIFESVHVLGPRWSIPKTLFMALGFTFVFFVAPWRSIWWRR